MIKQEMDKISLGADNILRLQQLLTKIPEISKFNDAGHDEVSTLAHGINDIAESSEKILDLMNQLRRSSNDSEIQDLLLSIGEELRHIIYHVQDSRYYQHLIP